MNIHFQGVNKWIGPIQEVYNQLYVVKDACIQQDRTIPIIGWDTGLGLDALIYGDYRAIVELTGQDKLAYLESVDPKLVDEYQSTEKDIQTILEAPSSDTLSVIDDRLLEFFKMVHEALADKFGFSSEDKFRTQAALSQTIVEFGNQRTAQVKAGEVTAEPVNVFAYDEASRTFKPEN
jgi:hypothetical protein